MAGFRQLLQSDSAVAASAYRPIWSEGSSGTVDFFAKLLDVHAALMRFKSSWAPVESRVLF